MRENIQIPSTTAYRAETGQTWPEMAARFLCRAAIRTPAYLASHPIFGARLFCKRLAFCLTRRFCGESIISPDGDPLFNVQSLTNHFALHVLRELDGGWCNHIRETVRPVIFDIGSNLWQFSRLARSMNPRARIFSADPWDEMEYFAQSEAHYPVGIGTKASAILTFAGAGMTATTSGLYDGIAKSTMEVECITLDDMFRHSNVDHIDVLKLDTDGAEVDVIESGPIALSKTRWLIAECQPDSLECLRRMFGAPTSSRNACRWGGDFVWNLETKL